MIKVTEFRLKNLQMPLIDIDITESNSWVGITGYLESPHLNHPESPFGTHIHFGDKTCKLHKDIRDPHVRAINEEMALVFGWSKVYDEKENKNAWIIETDGKIKTSFSTDSAVADIIITKGFIVVTYSDEAACYGEGLEVYDFEGKLLFGYEEIFGKEAVEISDCYAASLVKENQIIFCPYTEFPVVIFDIEHKTQKIYEIPAGIRGFRGITKREDKIYFHHSYNDRFGIYEWQIGSNKFERIGEYQNYFVRGLPDGKFLAKNESGYSIISVL